MIPEVGLNLDYGTDNANFPQDNGNGIGDILVGPFLQWDPVMGARGPLFMHRIELQMIFPTGEYDENKELNPGSNFSHLTPTGPSPPFWGLNSLPVDVSTICGTGKTMIPAGGTRPWGRMTPRLDRPSMPTLPWHMKSYPTV